ncbi:MAG TPA: DUF2249 domain-containing protein [Kofleriaceae bacterium]|nr:DUF2249 domain-containing protein [Kofleriaceae bacterium]
MLALSSDAGPGLSLEALDAACRARGFDGVELAVMPGEDPAAVVSRAAQARVVALRAASLEDAAELADASRTLAAPVSIAANALAPALLDRVVARFERAGARLLIGHGSDLDGALAALGTVRARDSAALGLAWEIEPAALRLDIASAVLFATRELLGVVRLHGGGPEQRHQDGRGVGPLLGDLALSGYTGPIVLCPSSSDAATLATWSKWIDTAASCGCGHAASTREHALDMRDVEPRDRLSTILGAYATLIPGATLRLTLDHDPMCMYYTLEATEPARSFDFQVVESGPEVWRAEVTKR